MTILISLMSDTFFSRLQKRAERFGVKGGEDQRYIEERNFAHEHPTRWKKFTKKIFRRKPKKRHEEKDVEQAQDGQNTGDEILREEVLEEVQSMQRAVDEEVGARIGYY
jgi:hypothetical protein